MFLLYKLILWFLFGYVFEFMDWLFLLWCFKFNCIECGWWCDVCGMMVEGFLYYYRDNFSFDFYFCCVMLEKEMVIEGVKFRFDIGNKLKKCDCCDFKRVKGSVKEFLGWFYKLF